MILSLTQREEKLGDTIFKRYTGKRDIDKRIKQSKLNQKIETINKYNETYREFLKVSP